MTALLCSFHKPLIRDGGKIGILIDYRFDHFYWRYVRSRLCVKSSDAHTLSIDSSVKLVLNLAAIWFIGFTWNDWHAASIIHESCNFWVNFTQSTSSPFCALTNSHWNWKLYHSGRHCDELATLKMEIAANEFSLRRECEQLRDGRFRELFRANLSMWWPHTYKSVKSWEAEATPTQWTVVTQKPINFGIRRVRIDYWDTLKIRQTRKGYFPVQTIHSQWPALTLHQNLQ